MKRPSPARPRNRRFRATDTRGETATFFLRTETELILKSRRVVPARLLQDDFAFQFPDWLVAARDLCERW